MTDDVIVVCHPQYGCLCVNTYWDVDFIGGILMLGYMSRLFVGCWSFYVIAICKVISGWISTSATAHSWKLYSVVPLENQLSKCFTSWQHLRSYEDGYWLSTVRIHCKFIVLPPLGNEAADTKAWCPTQSHYPDTELTSPCHIPMMPSTWLGSDKYKLWSINFISH